MPASTVKRVPCAAIITLLVAPFVHANDFQPAKVDVFDGLGLAPELALSNGFNDNTANLSGDEIDSWFTIVEPSLKLQGGDAISNVMASYKLSHGIYHSSDEDDFTDHRVATELHHEFTSKHRLDLGYKFGRIHEQRGTGISEGQGDSLAEVAEKDLHQADIIYGIGVRDARFNFDFNLGYEDLGYRNYQSLSQYSDYDQVHGGATVYWRLGPKTSLLLDWQLADKSYDLLAASGTSRDSSDQSIRLGIRWQASGASAGTFKVGYEDRDYDDAGRADFSGLTWALGAEWAPKSYSRFFIESGRAAKDPDTLGDYVKETQAKVRWEHGWTERFTSVVGMAYQDEEFTGIDRNDEALEANLGIRFNWRRWLNTELSYQYVDQDSNIDALSYEKNVYWLTLTAAL